MIPAFLGSEPVSVIEGEHADTEALQKEQDIGIAFIQSLNSDQQELALIRKEKTQDNMKTPPFQDILEIEYKGVNAEELNTSQQEGLLYLIKLYVGNMRKGYAKVRMDQIRKSLLQKHYEAHADNPNHQHHH